MAVNSMAVVQRELRAQSRSALNYWMRVAGAGSAVVVCWVLLQTPNQNPAEFGATLFGNLNALLYAVIVLGVPLLAADCLSKERREGTLGLLFLTPLTPEGVVVAKSAVHAVRALTLMATTLPILCASFLFGGAGWKEVLLAVVMNSSAFLLALTAGLLASALATQWRWAMAMATLFSALFVLAEMFVFAVVITLAEGVWANLGGTFSGFGVTLSLMPAFVTGYAGFWSVVISNTNVAEFWSIVCGAFAGLFLCVATFGVVLRVTARNLENNRLSEVRERKGPEWFQKFSSPMFWEDIFHSRLRRTLDANPIAWLHGYTTGARLTKWLWALAAVVVGFYMYESRVRTVTHLAWPLGFGMAFAAAGSFHREREMGVMELLLVSPLTEKQVIFGRLIGLWKQFLPSLVALIVVQASMCLRRYFFDIEFLWLVVSCFVALAPIGLYFSMREKHIAEAWLKAMFVTVCVPWIVAGVIVRISMAVAPIDFRPDWALFFLVLFSVTQLVMMLKALSLLHRNLATREFVLE